MTPSRPRPLTLVVRPRRDQPQVHPHRRDATAGLTDLRGRRGPRGDARGGRSGHLPGQPVVSHRRPTSASLMAGVMAVETQHLATLRAVGALLEADAGELRHPHRPGGPPAAAGSVATPEPSNPPTWRARPKRSPLMTDTTDLQSHRRRAGHQHPANRRQFFAIGGTLAAGAVLVAVAATTAHRHPRRRWALRDHDPPSRPTALSGHRHLRRGTGAACRQPRTRCPRRRRLRCTG